MIKHIHGKFKFNGSSATITVNFQPQQGITAVVGKNGSGKTVTASESVRYLLFGTKALRAALNTYQVIDIAGKFVIGGQEYTIVRTLKSSEIFDASGLSLAVGAEETNNKVIEILGYDLGVFDLCNSALQKGADSLGNLLPSKRKELIDRVLKITDVSQVEKALRSEGTNLRREATAMQQMLRPVGEPPLVTIEASYDVLDGVVSDLRTKRDQRLKLERQIESLSSPVKPAIPDVSDDELKTLVDLDALVREQERERDKLQVRIDAGLGFHRPTKTEIERGRAAREWQEREDARGPRPTMTLSDVEAQLSTYDTVAAMGHVADIDVECPNCEHQFNPRHAVPELPSTSHSELKEQQRRHEKWRDVNDPAPCDKYPALSEREIAEKEAAQRRYDDGLAAKKELEDLGPPEAPVTALIDQANTSRALWKAYREALEKDKAVRESNAMITAQLEDMPVITDEEIDKAIERRTLREQQDTALKVWTSEKQAFDELSEKIAQKNEEADQWTEGAKELAEGRAELKSLLAPGLSAEASALIFDMSNGVFQNLTVDEDMAITVDGQPLETLSGAGKTVANVALRIAFTRILTGSIFPVFIGDELDGDLDGERREATLQAMVSLKKNLKQIILITHRDVAIADHVIEIGTSNE